jgi:alkanesulfonate monooxygenase SsuD/methylene tetrahydromethanopterin reductase-like flavin-dependent oxidoreductase (luciferase family)
MTGTATIGGHIVPTITAAAEAAGRPAPRVVVSLPIAVTNDLDGAKERINEVFSIYPNLPSYKAMLDKEGAEAAADIAFVGDEGAVAASISKLADAGATDFVGAIVGDAEERARGFALLSELARS